MRLLVFALIAVGCGAKTDLADFSRPVPREDAGRRDGGRPRDAGVDSGLIFCDVCDDRIFCNGREPCDPITSACLPSVEPPDCDDGIECTVDSCDPASDSCVNVEVDRDDDGDGVSACEGDCDDSNASVFPGAPEVCNTIDDDCDGVVDDGVLSECRDCRPGCRRTTAPDETTMTWMPDDENSAGIQLDPEGTISLSRTRTESYFAWIANYLFATVTKLDTRTGAQVAEYDSVIVGTGSGAAPPGMMCEVEEPGGNCPSRTAVDLRGNLYVANRAFFGQGTVTKIAGFREDCIDRDGDGTVETSEDRDGDGVIERSVRGEFLGQMDECILWTVNVGPINGIPRAIAIAADGSVWVGLHGSQQALQLEAATGRVLRTVSLVREGFQPYGAAIDSRGRLWLVEAGTGGIVGIDTTTGAITTRRRTAVDREGCSSSYGIAIDSNDRVWLAGFLCTDAFRYDPATDRWITVRLPDSGVGRGIAADDRGNIYVASSHEWITFGPGGIEASDPIARLTVFRAEDGGGVRIFGTPSRPIPGRGSIGVGLDAMRRAWIINQDSSSATMIDPATGATREFATGISPYTYSDFTGFALRTFTAPNGFMRTVIDGCAMGPTEWERLEWDAETPPGTRVEIRVRTAPARAGLASATWIGPFETMPADLMLPPGPIPPNRFMEVEITLVSEDERSTPAVRNVTVQLNCPAG